MNITTPILEVEQLSVSFGAKKAVDSLNLMLMPSATHALVGESGSGKTLTCNAILGLLPASAKMSGGIKFCGKEISTLAGYRGSKVGYIPQNPINSLNPVRSVESQLIETIKLHDPNLNSAERIEQAHILLEAMQLRQRDRILKSFPFQLSGGMCQRIMIALALAGKPEILLADEPTTALDVTIQAEIMSLLLEMIRAKGLTLILVTHDLALVAQTCQTISVLREGKLLEGGLVEEVFRFPQHPYTAALLNSVRVLH
ncbi:MAG: ABC transporter ATP-binding protein [Candidatus Caenarcaniphilales bacterium]|nr:ABC transporter ATP-binding protein [Candidatus Caenarcaniphilales bacterium]